MEKSIESIWKQGFLDEDALVAPVVNDLYNQKSEHIIEKFKRMFRINLKAVVAGAILALIGFALMKMPITGIGLALVLIAIVVVNKRLLDGLRKVDKSESSFDYLKAFDSWMRSQVTTNARMAKWYYPAIFLSVAFGFWFSPHPIQILEAAGVELEFGFVLNGVPIFALIPMVIISIVLWIYGDRIYHWDLNIVYGRVLQKLDEILADMEELRAE